MPQNERPFLIGVTGSIGSGKTTACNIISLQYSVYYADEIVHQLLQEADLQTLLVQRWGDIILQAGQINRKALAELVFNDNAELNYLDSIIHPRVLARMQQLVNESATDTLVFEIPLLFEEHLEDCFDHILLLTASQENMKKRIQIRTGMTESDFQARLEKQLPEASKIQLADTIILNDGTLDELESQVHAFICKIQHLHRKDVRQFNKTVILK